MIEGPVGRNEAEGAVERTLLSWRRTVLSALAVMLIAVSKLALTAPRPWAVAVVALMAIAWVVITGIASRRMTSLRLHRRTHHSPALLALLLAAVAALAVALIA